MIYVSRLVIVDHELCTLVTVNAVNVNQETFLYVHKQESLTGN
jgi:hypothetical protein